MLGIVTRFLVILSTGEASRVPRTVVAWSEILRSSG